MKKLFSWSFESTPFAIQHRQFIFVLLLPILLPPPSHAQQPDAMTTVPNQRETLLANEHHRNQNGIVIDEVERDPLEGEALANQASGSAISDENFIVQDYDLHHLTDDIKHLLDVEVAPVASKKQRFIKLHDVLYKPHYLNLMYNANGTYTAAETFRKGSGNCISHANLFVAAARYVGLKAYYQSVEVPLEWRPRQGFYELPGHVNVVLKLGHYNATVEFNQAVFDEYDITSLKKKIISDARAKAEFYNNLGVDALSQNQFTQAKAYFEKAIETDKKSDISWSNMGVVLKKLGEFEKAELAYLEAIAINRKNKSAMKNLFVLYTQIGDEQNAETYRRDVEKYARKNPYYLEKLAKRAIDTQDYKLATKLYKKAIRIYEMESSFYHGLALSYYHQNKIRHAQKALNQAQVYADQGDKPRFSQKLQILGANQGI